MTRVNVISPKELPTKMLVAEYREITRIPNNLRKSLNRKSKPFNIKEIPDKYVLGKGHVKFFFDKMMFLKKRYEMLVQEMLDRGYNPRYRQSSVFDMHKKWMGDYNPTEEAIILNRKRIEERLNGKI